jgi:outer membrane receptor protein involved in Fe transport
MRQLTGLAALALLVFAVVSPVSGDPGNITGKVLDGKTKEPLPFSNVVIVGTPYGAMTMEDGSFFIRNVPEGTYALKASYMGYESEEHQAVAVAPFTTTETDFKLFKTVLRTTDEVLVTADRPMVEVDVPSTVRSVTEEELKEMPVTDIQDVVSLQAGVVEDADELHIRGGRTDETLYIIDGVRMKDRLAENSSLMQVSALAVQEMDVITGGYSAELGDAISGVVNVGLKEGGAKTKGYLEYSVDHVPFTDEGLASYNADQIEVGVEGPEPASGKLLPRIGLRLPGQITYFLGLSMRLSDTYLPSISDMPGSPHLKSSYEDKFLGINLNYTDLALRAENRWQAFGTVVWKYSSTNKFKLSFTKAIGIDQGYSRRNPYALERDVSGYEHAWSKHLDHFLTYTEDTNSLALSWNQMLSENSFHVLNISRVFHCLHTDVAGKNWSEYQEPMLDGPYFIGSGDADLWHDSYTETFSLSWDMTRRFPPHHQVKGGFNASYEDVQFIIISQPWVYDEDGLGYNHDLFHIYPNTGAFYIQDKVNYEGLIGDIGVRYDYWFPGEQVERAIEDESRTVISPSTRAGFKRDTHEIFGRRFKGHMSPRIAVSFPITDRDNLFFNYGHFSQLPNYVYVYSKLSSVSSEQFPIIGNPNLNPEISVQYEIGARHQFTQNVAGNITLTYKDIYDYPTSVRFTPLSGGDLFLYINRDYARSRGIEVEIKKKRTGLVGGALSYTYSIATGKSSDPNAQKLVQESGVDVKTGETSLAEEYLWWNRPHKLNISLRLGAGSDQRPELFGLRLPSDWNLNIQWNIQSGKAYTPTKDERETGKDYSRNGPADDIVDLRFTKYFKVGASKAKVFLDVKNLFNDRRVRRIDRETGEAYQAGKGTYRFYPNDSEWEILRKIYATEDPSIYGASRQARLGLGMEW